MTRLPMFITAAFILGCGAIDVNAQQNPGATARQQNQLLASTARVRIQRTSDKCEAPLSQKSSITGSCASSLSARSK
jgi:hypothetical protein